MSLEDMAAQVLYQKAQRPSDLNVFFNALADKTSGIVDMVQAKKERQIKLAKDALDQERVKAQIEEAKSLVKQREMQQKQDQITLEQKARGLDEESIRERGLSPFQITPQAAQSANVTVSPFLETRGGETAAEQAKYAFDINKPNPVRASLFTREIPSEANQKEQMKIDEEKRKIKANQDYEKWEKSNNMGIYYKETLPKGLTEYQKAQLGQDAINGAEAFVEKNWRAIESDKDARKLWDNLSEAERADKPNQWKANYYYALLKAGAITADKIPDYLLPRMNLSNLQNKSPLFDKYGLKPK